MREVWWMFDGSVLLLAALGVWLYGVVVRGAREIVIRVGTGEAPRAITVRQGEPLRLRLVRESASRCVDEIVFPSLGIRRALRLGEPLRLHVRPRDAGVIELFCGMNRLQGRLEVRPQL